MAYENKFALWFAKGGGYNLQKSAELVHRETFDSAAFNSWRTCWIRETTFYGIKREIHVHVTIVQSERRSKLNQKSKYVHHFI